MAYPKNLIQDGETVALDLRPHWWYFSRNILTGIPLFILVVIVLANVDTDGTLGKGTYWVVALVFLAWAAWLVLKYFQWVMTYFVVTSRRVIYRTGVLSKKGVEIPLERINNINFHQRIIDRIIGAGDLDIESAGKDGQSHFDFVRHPDGVQHEIYRQMETRNMPQNFPPAAAPAAAPVAAAPAAAPAPAANVPDQIEQLAHLRDQGHITPEEYEQKKSELLGRM
jgi:membrane protein YdbS with pleckstrin-like domain